MYFILSGGKAYDRTKLVDALADAGRLGVSGKVEFAQDFPIDYSHSEEVERMVGFAAVVNTARGPVFLRFGRHPGIVQAKALHFGELGELRKVLKIPECELEAMVQTEIANLSS